MTAGCFITGTGTGVGKTVLSAALTATLRERGVDVIALKPVLTGLDEPPDELWPPDHVLLARACGRAPEEVSSATFGPPVSPHLAAELAGRPIVRARLLEAITAAGADAEAVIVEGVGGLLVPLGQDFTVADLAADLRLPLIIAASAGLGTINHTLLTLEAARRRGLTPAAVVLTPWPAEPGAMERSNRATIARLGGVGVWTLPYVVSSEPAALAAAAAELPVEGWLGRP